MAEIRAVVHNGYALDHVQDSAMTLTAGDGIVEYGEGTVRYTPAGSEPSAFPLPTVTVVSFLFGRIRVWTLARVLVSSGRQSELWKFVVEVVKRSEIN